MSEFDNAPSISSLPEEQTIEDEWVAVQIGLKQYFLQKTPDLQAVLFIIGLREKGWGPGKYTKEQKQDLMNLACCRVLSEGGYFKARTYDRDGWPIWEQTAGFPKKEVNVQEQMLKHYVYCYFEKQNLIPG